VSNRRTTPDLVAAWATGVGVGSIVFMLGWLIGSRMFEAAWPAPTGPALAMATAILLGLVAAVVSGLRLARRVRIEQSVSAEQ